ncbi:MAG: glutamine amidotransferase-related protein [Promethearchaeota archaeon]
MKKKIHVISNYNQGFFKDRTLLSDTRERGLNRIRILLGEDFPDQIEWSRHSFLDLEDDGVFNSILAGDGVILSGSSLNLSSEDCRELMAREMELVKQLKEKDVPTLGICFGHQLIALTFGARVDRMTGDRFALEENKLVSIEFQTPFPIYNPPPPRDTNSMRVDENHNDEVIETDDFTHEFVIYSKSGPANAIQAIKHKSAAIFGVQFHPETFVEDDQTRNDGYEIFRGFLSIILSRQ